MNKLIIFTDLDGTLLDASTYSFDAAGEALSALRERGVPLVICSSKTRPEIEHFRRLLQNEHPFISENGGGIFIPRGYAELRSPDVEAVSEDFGKYRLLRLGAAYVRLRAGIEELRKRGFTVRGFGDMSGGEVSVLTALPLALATMAMERDFDEPFLFEGDKETTDRLIRTVAELGYRVTRGRFWHLIGDSDKGRAVSVLIAMYRQRFGDLQTVAVGDAPNDISMLRAVDCPLVVRRPDGSVHPELELPGFRLAAGVGPEGWNKAVLEILEKGDRSERQ